MKKGNTKKNTKKTKWPIFVAAAAVVVIAIIIAVLAGGKNKADGITAKIEIGV